MGKWAADLASDPRHDHRLYLELLENEEFKGRVYRADDGQIQIAIYGGVDDIPWDWLSAIVERFRSETQSA